MIDLVYLIMFGLFLTTFLIFYSKFTSNLWIETKKSKEKLNFILESTNVVTFSFEKQSQQMLVSTGLSSFPSFPGSYKTTSPILWEGNVHPDDIEITKNVVDELFLGKQQNAEFRLVDSNEKVIWVYCRYVPLLGADYSVQNVEGIYLDITERKLAEEKVKYLAYHDYLTELPNRSQLDCYFSKLKTTAQEIDQQIFLIFIDLDSFKLINDQYGHDVGDKLLKVVAKRLDHCLRDCDLISRLGGDEFVAIIEGVTDEKAIEVAERVKNSLTVPYLIDEHPISITPSIGISKCSSTDDDLDVMIKKADIAMYDVKKSGKNNVRFYVGI